MNCCKCKNEMELGYIQVPNVRLVWSPEKKKKIMFARVNWQIDGDELALGKYNYFFGSKVLAYKCYGCGIILINFKWFFREYVCNFDYYFAANTYGWTAIEKYECVLLPNEYIC